MFANTDPTNRKSDGELRNLQNKRINRTLSLQGVGKVGGSSRSDTDGHDPSLRTPTRLAGNSLARDLQNKRLNRILSLQRVGTVGGSSQSGTDEHDPSAIKKKKKRKKKRKRMIRVMSFQRIRRSLL